MTKSQREQEIYRQVDQEVSELTFFGRPGLRKLNPIRWQIFSMRFWSPILVPNHSNQCLMKLAHRIHILN